MKRTFNDAIAIVGMGLRLPGDIQSPKDFWEKLLEGFDAIDDIPSDRWNKDSYYHPDWTIRTKINTTKGGFIDGVDQFDADFFRIAPVEAPFIDPQQRILLEVTHHALEDAGISFDAISKTRCGVFVGATLCDYNSILRHPENLAEVSAFSSAGATLGILANRVSHVFNLKGPSLTIDTACSSSITCLHLAIQSLRAGECDVALVSGVNLILSPETSMGQSKGGFVSPDGHCKAFDAQADGYVRSEGAVVLVLCREEMASRYANHYASVVSSSINHNGRNLGLSAPSEKAQRDLIEAGLKAAHLDPKKISYVEAHGTGTVVGDVVEAAAIGKAIGKGRRTPLPIGAVKANIGHIEPGSGVVGLAKVALALKNEMIPAHRLSSEANPRIPFKKYGLYLPTSTKKWSSRARRYAAVNSFGFGGANAFAVVANAKKRPVLPPDSRGVSYLFLLSAHSRQALSEQVRSYLHFLEDATADIRDICYSAALHRTHFAHRLSVVVASVEQLKFELKSFVEGQHSRCYSRPISQTKRKIAFVMTGQGGQWPKMGLGLREFPAFDRHFKTLAKKWQDNHGVDVQAILDSKRSRTLADTRNAQAALLTLQASLSQFLADCDVVADGYVGHSVGEVAAALCCGVINTKDALSLTKARSELQARFHGQGKMLLGECSIQEANDLCERFGKKFDIAAINAPNSIVFSGDAESLEELERHLLERQRSAHWLSSTIPFHSQMMSEIAPELARNVQRLRSSISDLDFYSTVSGKKEKNLVARHWERNLCEAVNFSSAIEEMTLDGYNTFIEIGPRPTHIIDINKVTSFHQKPDILVRSMLDPKLSDRETVLDLLGTLWACGAKVRLESVFFEKFNSVTLPYFKWTKRTYWSETLRAREARIKPIPTHPFLGKMERSFGADKFILQSLICDQRIHPFVTSIFATHKRLISPFYFLECARAVWSHQRIRSPLRLHSLQIEAPVSLDEQGTLPGLQLELNSRSGEFSIHCAEDRSQDATFVASGVIGEATFEAKRPVDLDSIRSEFAMAVDVETFYSRLSQSGLDVPSDLRSVVSIRRGENGVLLRLRLPQKLHFGKEAFVLHPAIVDACLQATDVLLEDDPIRKDKLGIYYPSHIEVADLFSQNTTLPNEEMFALVQVKDLSSRTIDFTLWSSTGERIAAVSGMKLEIVENTRQSLNPVAPKFFMQDWTTTETVAEHARRPFEFSDVLPRVWLTFVDNDVAFQAMERQFSKEKLTLIKVLQGKNYEQKDASFHLDGASYEHVKRLLLDAGIGSADYGVLYMWSLMEQSQTISDSLRPLFHLTKAMSENKRRLPLKVLLATSHALSVGDQGTHSLMGSSVLAFGRVLYREFEPCRVICVDLEDVRAQEERLSLFYEIFEKYNQPEVAYRNGRRFALRYAEQKLPSSSESQMLSFDPKANYLVTGGTSGLGLKIAVWLAKCGAKNLILASRNGPRSTQDREEIEAVRSSGINVEIVACDISNERDVVKMIEQIPDQRPLRGIFHAAAVYNDQLIRDVTTEAFDSVFDSKALGAYHLHNATYYHRLDHFVMISSISNLFGNVGQASYAIANQFLDTLAYARHAQGLAAKVINFGPIAEAGYLAAHEPVARALLMQGFRPLSIAEFEEGLNGALKSANTQSIYCEIDWHRFSQHYSLAVHEHRFRYIMMRQLTDESQMASSDAQMLRQTLLKEQNRDRRRSCVEEAARAELRRILGATSGNFNVDRPVRELGLDSLMAMQLRLFISSNLQIDFPYVEVMSSEGPKDLADRVLKVFDAANDRNAHPAP